jgi:hypothetical protein
MDSEYEKMLAALLTVNRFCDTCQAKHDPKIDDSFIICSKCGRIKRKVFESKKRKKKKGAGVGEEW